MTVDYNIKDLGSYSCDTKNFIIGNLDAQLKKALQENESLRLNIRQLKFGIEAQADRDIQKFRPVAEIQPPIKRGRGRPRITQYLSYNEARAWAQEQGITSSAIWRQYIRLHKNFPRNRKVPRDPAVFYKNAGWEGWDKFLGRQTLAEKHQMATQATSQIFERMMEKREEPKQEPPKDLKLEKEVTA